MPGRKNIVANVDVDQGVFYGLNNRSFIAADLVLVLGTAARLTLAFKTRDPVTGLESPLILTPGTDVLEVGIKPTRAPGSTEEYLANSTDFTITDGPNGLAYIDFSLAVPALRTFLSRYQSKAAVLEVEIKTAALANKIQAECILVFSVVDDATLTPIIPPSYLPLTGGSLSGGLGLGGNKITALGTPTLADDATTKAYVDGLAGGVSDGDKGDIVVSGSGAVWTVDALAIDTGKIAAGAVTAAKLAETLINANGSVSMAGDLDINDNALKQVANVYSGNSTGAVIVLDEGGDKIRIETGTGTVNHDFAAAGVVLNVDQADIDLQFKSPTNADLLKIDSGNDRVGIGVGAPAEALDVAGNIGVTGTVAGRDLAMVDGPKLDGIETGATADQSNAEIETAYNAQVQIVSQVAAEAGTSTTPERWTPQRVAQAIAALGGGGGSAGGRQFVRGSDFLLIDTGGTDLTGVVQGNLDTASFNMVGVGIATDSGTEQNGILKAVFNAPDSSTQLATANAFRLRWWATSNVGTNCRIDDITVTGCNGVGALTTVYSSGTDRVATTADTPEVLSITATSLTHFEYYVVEITLTTKDDHSVYIDSFEAVFDGS